MRTLRAEAECSLTTPEGVFPCRLVLLMKRPGRSRVEVFDPFGALRGLAIGTGRGVFRYLPGGEGAAGPLPELLSAERLGGEAGAGGETLVGLAAGFPGARAVRLPLRWGLANMPEVGDEAAHLAMHGGRPVADRVALRDPLSGEGISFAYEGFRENGGGPLPGRVTVSLPERGWALEIRYRMLEANVEIDDDLFRPVPGFGS